MQQSVVWQLLDYITVAGRQDEPDTVALHLRSAGAEYTVTVSGLALTIGQSVEALRAAQAHIHKAVGAPLPAGSRLPEPGEVMPELPAPKSVQ